MFLAALCLLFGLAAAPKHVVGDHGVTTKLEEPLHELLGKLWDTSKDYSISTREVRVPAVHGDGVLAMLEIPVGKAG